jgi:SpoVK/Ycf46/Vps4 family AAA+-type ATPase
LLQPEASRARLDQVVLDADARAELCELIAAVRARATVMRDWGLGARCARGRGLSALLSGESGTGKTLACEVVAAECGLPLLRVNAAVLVDKYIGETEKNLARAFAQARAAGAILLFDEADALFGARTQVKGANDRYANLETNVLLQLMEEHAGVVLLTTNLAGNIDRAFLRRIAFKIALAPPDEAARAAIWRIALAGVQTEETVDVELLAERFPLAGGGIRNAVLRAAYRAAAAGRKITQADLGGCAALEYQGSGRVVAWRE